MLARKIENVLCCQDLWWGDEVYWEDHSLFLANQEGIRPQHEGNLINCILEWQHDHFSNDFQVEGIFYVNHNLESLMFDELKASCQTGQVGGFLPGMKQIANVAALPGIVGRSIGLPDVHSGYGFAIGNLAAFDMDDPQSVVSPGGVGFDINCGVRLLRTNLTEKDVQPVKVEMFSKFSKKKLFFKIHFLISRSNWLRACLITFQWVLAPKEWFQSMSKIWKIALRWAWIGLYVKVILRNFFLIFMNLY